VMERLQDSERPGAPLKFTLVDSGVSLDRVMPPKAYP
jgi:hypothetical protein